MKFAFPVKHNGVYYAVGQNVPIGKEVVNHEDEISTLTANDIRERLKKLGVTKFPSNKKDDLLAMLKEKEAEAEKESEDEGETNKDEEESDLLEAAKTAVPEKKDEEKTESEGEGTLLDKIINNEE